MNFLFFFQKSEIFKSILNGGGFFLPLFRGVSTSWGGGRFWEGIFFYFWLFFLCEGDGLIDFFTRRKNFLIFWGVFRLSQMVFFL